MKVAVFGATGKAGRFVVTLLCERGHEVTAVGRSHARLAALVDARAHAVLADLSRPETLADALAGAQCVVNVAHARFAVPLLQALPPGVRLVMTGSTRRFTRLPDPAADAVRAGEAAFLASGRRGVVLHPSMIYGPRDDRNVGRLLRLLRRFPAAIPIPVPLPDGGRHTVQPVFVEDVAAAVVAAVENPDADGPSIVVPGPAPITYRLMVETCAQALGRRVAVVAIPSRLLVRLAALAAHLKLRLPFSEAEFARAAEDKAFDPGELERRLGVRPRPFAEGLRLKLQRGWI